MASSAEFESLSLHALAVCTWPHCASAFHLLKTDDNGGDDDDNENDDNRMYISGLFSRWNELICMKHLELRLVHGKGSLSLLVALYETNRTVWVRKGVRDCVFPLHHGLCPGQVAKSFKQRLVQVHLVRQHREARKLHSLTLGPLCSLYKHTLVASSKSLSWISDMSSSIAVTFVGPRNL